MSNNNDKIVQNFLLFIIEINEENTNDPTLY